MILNLQATQWFHWGIDCKVTVEVSQDTQLLLVGSDILGGGLEVACHALVTLSRKTLHYHCWGLQRQGSMSFGVGMGGLLDHCMSLCATWQSIYTAVSTLMIALENDLESNNIIYIPHVGLAFLCNMKKYLYRRKT